MSWPFDLDLFWKKNRPFVLVEEKHANQNKKFVVCFLFEAFDIFRGLTRAILWAHWSEVVHNYVSTQGH